MLIEISACDVFLSAFQVAKSPSQGPKPVVYASAIWRAQDLFLSRVPLLSKLLTGAAFPTNPLPTLWPLTIALTHPFWKHHRGCKICGWTTDRTHVSGCVLHRIFRHTFALLCSGQSRNFKDFYSLNVVLSRLPFSSEVFKVGFCPWIILQLYPGLCEKAKKKELK